MYKADRRRQSIPHINNAFSKNILRVLLTLRDLNSVDTKTENRWSWHYQHI